MAVKNFPAHNSNIMKSTSTVPTFSVYIWVISTLNVRLKKYFQCCIYRVQFLQSVEKYKDLRKSVFFPLHLVWNDPYVTTILILCLVIKFHFILKKITIRDCILILDIYIRQREFNLSLIKKH